MGCRCCRSWSGLAEPTSGATWASTTCCWAPCAPERLRLEGEAEHVLTDRDHVAVGQLLLDHGLTVDERSVGAAQVADPEGPSPYLDPSWRPEVAGWPTTTSLSGARPMLTIWFGRATIRPANGPDSKLRRAANPVPDATCSGGIACSETVPLGSASGSVCCQTGITDVASSNDPASAGAPLPGAATGDPDGQATSVELTSGVVAPAVCRPGCVMAVEAMARSGSGSATGGGGRGLGFGRGASARGSGIHTAGGGARA